MDYERALKKVDEYHSLCEAMVRVQESLQWRVGQFAYLEDPGWQEYDRALTEGLPLLEAIAQEIDPRLRERLRNTSIYPVRDACRELRGAIMSRQEITEILGTKGPQLHAAQLHPWVWQNAAQLWSDGHRRAAVQAAATALFDVQLPAKLGRLRDTKGGADLMGQAFSTKTPEPGAPRLRFAFIPDGTPEWTSAHEGAMKLGQGAAQAIRNLTTHDLTEPAEQDALEMLAVLSYVARLVDKATVVNPP